MKSFSASAVATEAMEKPPVHPSARRPIQGRDYSGRSPVGAMAQGGHGFKKAADLGPHEPQPMAGWHDVRPTFDSSGPVGPMSESHTPFKDGNSHFG
jgi:hypothetical protein